MHVLFSFVAYGNTKLYQMDVNSMFLVGT